MWIEKCNMNSSSCIEIYRKSLTRAAKCWTSAEKLGGHSLSHDPCCWYSRMDEGREHVRIPLVFLITDHLSLRFLAVLRCFQLVWEWWTGFFDCILRWHWGVVGLPGCLQGCGSTGNKQVMGRWHPGLTCVVSAGFAVVMAVEDSVAPDDLMDK